MPDNALMAQLLSDPDALLRLGISSAMSPGGDTGVGAGARLATGQPTPEVPVPSWPGLAGSAALGALPVGKMAAAAPRTAKALLGLAGSGLASDIGSGQAETVDPRLGEVNALTQRIQKNEAEIGRLGTTKTASPPGTQAKVIDTIQKSLDRDTVRLKELQGILGAEDASKRQAEKPFREEYPNVYRNLPLVGWGLSALGGAMGSKGGSLIRSMIGGAIGGIPGSTAAAVAPTAYDAATLPTGSPHQKEAVDWLRNPDYWAGRVLPEVLVGAGAGATAGKFGSQLRGAPLPPVKLKRAPAKRKSIKKSEVLTDHPDLIDDA